MHVIVQSTHDDILPRWAATRAYVTVYPFLIMKCFSRYIIYGISWHQYRELGSSGCRERESKMHYTQNFNGLFIQYIYRHWDYTLTEQFIITLLFGAGTQYPSSQLFLKSSQLELKLGKDKRVQDLACVTLYPFPW